MCKVNNFFAYSGRFCLPAYNFLNNFKIEEAFFGLMVGEIVKNSLILHLEIRVSPNIDTEYNQTFSYRTPKPRRRQHMSAGVGAGQENKGNDNT